MRNTTCQIRRAGGERNEYGEWEAAYGPEEPADLYSEPVSDADSGRTRLILPEGQRIDDLRKFWLPAHVAALSLVPPDRIEARGDTWEIVKEDRYDGPLGHQVAWCSMVHPQPAPVISDRTWRPTRAHVERHVRAAIAAASGLASGDVIPAPDDGPRPAGRYAAVRLMAISPSDPEAEYSPTKERADTLDRSDSVAVRSVYSAEFYRAGAIDLAGRCRTALAGPGSHTLRGLGISVLDTSEDEVSTDLVGPAWEEAGRFLMTLSYAQRLTTEVEAASHFGLTLVLRHGREIDISTP